MSNKLNVTVGDGFKFGLGFTFGSLVASLILVPIFMCGGFALMTLLGGTLASLLGNIGP